MQNLKLAPSIGLKTVKIDRRDLMALAALIMLWMLFFWRYLTPNEADRVAFPQGDFTDQFYAFRTFAFNEFKAGRFPLWMPCVFSGYPFQADPQSSLFYPPATLNLLLFLKAEKFPLKALELEAMLHVLAASVFTYLFLRQKFKRRTSSLLGSIVFAYGGYLTSYPPLQLAILETATWLPLALLSVEILNERGGRAIVPMALVLSMSYLSGHPQTFAHLLYATLAYYVYLAWKAKRSWQLAAFRVLISLFIFFGLCAVQLIPSIEYFRLSSRPYITFEEVAKGFPTKDVLQFVFTGLASYWQPLYIGILPLFLIWLAIIAWRRQDIIFWLGLAIIALILSFGSNLFGFEIAYLFLPSYKLFRQQERHAFLVSFALSVITANGLEVFTSPLRRRERIMMGIGVRFLRNLLPLVFLLLCAATFLANQGLDPEGNLAKHLSILFIVMCFAVMLIYARLYLPRARLWVTLLAIASVVINLFSLNRTLNYAKPYDPFPVTPLIELMLKEKGLFRIQDDWRLRGHTACMHGLNEVWGIAPIRLARYEEFMNRAPEEVRWKLLGVRFVVTWRGSLITREGKAVNAELLYHDGKDTFLYKIKDEPKRAFVVHDARVAKNRDELYAILSSPDFDPYHSVVVQEPILLEPALSNNEHVEIINYTPTKVVVKASLLSHGLLILGDVNYPGWKAYLNGQPLKIYEANSILRAVGLPPGQSIVEFRYEPLSFYVGAFISAFTLLFVSIYCFWKSKLRLLP